MRINSRIAWVLGSVCLISSLFAENGENSFASPSPSFGKAQLSDVAKRVDAAEKKASEISEVKVSKELGIKNPYALGCIGGKEGMFTQLSFLYWQAITEGLYYATQYIDTNPMQISKLRTVKFDAKPGVRYTLGYTSGYDAWNVQGIYTWNHFTGSRSGVAQGWSPGVAIGFKLNDSFQDVLTDILGLVSGTYFQNAGAHWRLNYNVGDVQFGRGFFITKALTLQPFLGARVAVLDQKFRCYFAGSWVHVSPLAPWAYKIVNHTDYWGIGPRIGIDSKWTLPHNFGITGLLSGSLLYGKVKRDLRSYETEIGTTTVFEEAGKQINSFNLIAPNVQLALGLDWGMSFDKDRIYWGLNLGWEFNYWWQPLPFLNNQQFPQPFEIQGLTLRTDLHF